MPCIWTRIGFVEVIVGVACSSVLLKTEKLGDVDALLSVALGVSSVEAYSRIL
jgi:hypothetical protein